MQNIQKVQNMNYGNYTYYSFFILFILFLLLGNVRKHCIRRMHFCIVGVFCIITCYFEYRIRILCILSVYRNILKKQNDLFRQKIEKFTEVCEQFSYEVFWVGVCVFFKADWHPNKHPRFAIFFIFWKRKKKKKHEILENKCGFFDVLIN